MCPHNLHKLHGGPLFDQRAEQFDHLITWWLFRDARFVDGEVGSSLVEINLRIVVFPLAIYRSNGDHGESSIYSNTE
jgi:hypothetical protein